MPSPLSLAVCRPENRSEDLAFPDETQLVAPGTAAGILTRVPGKKRKLAVVTEVKTFFDYSPAERTSAPSFIPDPQDPQKQDPAENIDIEQLNRYYGDHFFISPERGGCFQRTS